MDEEGLEGGRFFMKHITYENWIRYVQGKAQQEEHFEQHLYECDQCLTLYMEALETEQIQSPTLTTKEIVHSIKNNRKERKESSNVSSPIRFHRKLVHYILAAGMTLFLMSSGVFSEMSKLVDRIEAKPNNNLSVVTHFMEHSISIVDQVNMKEVHRDEK